MKQLVSEHGILILPNSKKGRALSLEIESLVKTFHECDDISRMMPGMIDFVSVKMMMELVHMFKKDFYN